MSNYTDLHEEIKACETHKQLLAVVEKITYNKRELKLDDYEVERLEDAGMRSYEQIEYNNQDMMRNKKR